MGASFPSSGTTPRRRGINAASGTKDSRIKGISPSTTCTTVEPKSPATFPAIPPMKVTP